MQSRFINRKKELAFLNKQYNSNNFQLIIIHGRRRIGKTELIKEFIRDKNSVYILADNIPEKVLLEQIYIDTTSQISGQSLLFKNINDYFKFLGDQGEQRLIVVFDEFQNMMARIDGIESILQRFVDQYWQSGKLFIILCGSEIRMMQKLFSYTNPLYGRRTGQLKIKGFEFRDLIEFFPTLNLSELLLVWGIYGSTPAYLRYYDPEISLFENLETTILSEIHPLFEEPKFLLIQEFKETQRYSGILQKIADGNTRVIDIANAIGIDARSLPKYLNILLETDLITKQIPVGAKEKTHYIRYQINDAFINFWYHFISPNRSNLLYETESVMKKIRTELDRYMGYYFETACLSIFYRLNARKRLYSLFTDISKWWRKDMEFDMILMNQNEVLILELKYGKNTSCQTILNKLKTKISNSVFRSKNVHYGIIAQGFKNKKRGCITLDTCIKALDKDLSLEFIKFNV